MAEKDSKSKSPATTNPGDAAPAKDIAPMAPSVPATERPRFPKASVTHRLQTFYPGGTDDGDS